jgi:hypothetical protein
MDFFETEIRAWLASLPEYDSNEAAKDDGYPVGWPYWCGARLLKVI